MSHNIHMPPIPIAEQPDMSLRDQYLQLLGNGMSEDEYRKKYENTPYTLQYQKTASNTGKTDSNLRRRATDAISMLEMHPELALIYLPSLPGQRSYVLEKWCNILGITLTYTEAAYLSKLKKNDMDYLRSAFDNQLFDAIFTAEPNASLTDCAALIAQHMNKGKGTNCFTIPSATIGISFASTTLDFPGATEFGLTPLMLAAMMGKKEIVQQLIESGSFPIDQTDIKGRSALDYAYWHPETQALIRSIQASTRNAKHADEIETTDESDASDKNEIYSTDGNESDITDDYVIIEKAASPAEDPDDFVMVNNPEDEPIPNNTPPLSYNPIQNTVFTFPLLNWVKFHANNYFQTPQQPQSKSDITNDQQNDTIISENTHPKDQVSEKDINTEKNSSSFSILTWLKSFIKKYFQLSSRSELSENQSQFSSTIMNIKKNISFLSDKIKHFKLIEHSNDITLQSENHHEPTNTSPVESITNAEDIINTHNPSAETDHTANAPENLVDSEDMWPNHLDDIKEKYPVVYALSCGYNTIITFASHLTMNHDPQSTDSNFEASPPEPTTDTKPTTAIYFSSLPHQISHWTSYLFQNKANEELIYPPQQTTTPIPSNIIANPQSNEDAYITPNQKQEKNASTIETHHP